jgi:hypothetical protein
VVLRVRCSHEMAPPWTDRLEGVSLDFRVPRPQLAEAAVSLRAQLDRFPPRAGLDRRPQAPVRRSSALPGRWGGRPVPPSRRDSAGARDAAPSSPRCLAPDRHGGVRSRAWASRRRRPLGAPRPAAPLDGTRRPAPSRDGTPRYAFRTDRLCRHIDPRG